MTDDKNRSVIRLENILVYMEKNNYFEKSFYNKVVILQNNILNNGLSKEYSKEVEEVNKYFIENIYEPPQTNLDNGLSNVWSKNRNAFRGM